MKARWIAAIACCAAGACAGDLKDPERFAFLVGDGGDAAAGASDAAVDAGGVAGGADAARMDSGAMPAAGDVPGCVTDVFAMHCASATCHGAGAAQIDLVSAGVGARLVGKQAASGGVCAGRTYVASDGSESLLLDKLSDAPPCGSKMPLVGADLSGTERQCLMDWVASLGGGA